MFFDRRLVHQGDASLFSRIEPLGERCLKLFDQPDAGLWELRGSLQTHTFTAVMCWAGCDRMARIAAQLGLKDRAHCWSERARQLHQEISERGWNPKTGTFVATFDGDTLDASLLRLNELFFVADDGVRGTHLLVLLRPERKRVRLRRPGAALLGRRRHRKPVGPGCVGFGTPEYAFLVCTFWYIYALAAIGDRDEACAMFENVLACRNRHVLLAEHIDPKTKEQWGNFVQTYSMVGLISSAIRLSQRWDQAF